MSELLNMDERDGLILNNFAGINKHIQFWPGSVLTSVHQSKKLLARAKTNMQLSHTFALDNLSQFMNVVGLFEKPKIMINDNYMDVKDSRHSMRYTFTDTENIVSKNPDDKIEMNESLSFDLAADTLKDIQKAASVLGMPNAAFIGKGGTAYLQVLNASNPTTHLYSTPLGETEEDFRMVMKVELLSKIYIDDYHVILDFDKLMANFSNDGMSYWLAMEYDL